MTEQKIMTKAELKELKRLFKDLINYTIIRDTVDPQYPALKDWYTDLQHDTKCNLRDMLYDL